MVGFGVLKASASPGIVQLAVSINVLCRALQPCSSVFSDQRKLQDVKGGDVSEDGMFPESVLKVGSLLFLTEGSVSISSRQ